VVRNPASSREETEIDVSHDFYLMVMMTWTDVEIGIQNVDNLLVHAENLGERGVELMNRKLGGSNCWGVVQSLSRDADASGEGSLFFCATLQGTRYLGALHTLDQPQCW